MFAYAGLAALLAGTALVRADPVPTAPGPGDVFKEGGQCTFTWDVDSTGEWKTMNVELMSGDNWNMVHITTVATLDGTDASKTTYSYDCPQVKPNSPIYFYQFTSPDAANRTWTTRFAIADTNGNTTPAPNATQPDGSSIPWGLGALVDPSTAVAAPSYLASGATGSTGSTGTATGSTGSTAGPSPAAGSTAGSSSGVGTPAAAPPASSSSSTASPSSGAQSSAPPSGASMNTSTTTTTANTNSTGGAGNANGAMSALAIDGYLVRATCALGAAAFAFAVVL